MVALTFPFPLARWQSRFLLAAASTVGVIVLSEAVGFSIAVAVGVTLTDLAVSTNFLATRQFPSARPRQMFCDPN